jgi:hypothetical protein
MISAVYWFEEAGVIAGTQRARRTTRFDQMRERGAIVSAYAVVLITPLRTGFRSTCGPVAVGGEGVACRAGEAVFLVEVQLKLAVESQVMFPPAASYW